MTKDFKAIFQAADKAGKAAAEACTPIPMVVFQREHPLDDKSPITKVYEPVMGGVCGFAWVKFPGNAAFGRWMKAQGLANKGYPTGLSYWVRGYGQSMTKKEAYAGAFAHSLREAGVEKVYAESRMD